MELNHTHSVFSATSKFDGARDAIIVYDNIPVTDNLFTAHDIQAGGGVYTHVNACRMHQSLGH